MAPQSAGTSFPEHTRQRDWKADNRDYYPQGTPKDWIQGSGSGPLRGLGQCSVGILQGFCQRPQCTRHSVSWLLWGDGLRVSGSPHMETAVTSVQPGRLPVGPQTGKTAHVTPRSILWLCLLLLVTGCSLRALWLLILGLEVQKRSHSRDHQDPARQRLREFWGKHQEEGCQANAWAVFWGNRDVSSESDVRPQSGRQFSYL